jgi:hypothetical protein
LSFLSFLTQLPLFLSLLIIFQFRFLSHFPCFSLSNKLKLTSMLQNCVARRCK